MSSENPILDKNLECIARYNPALKEELLNLPFLTTMFELVETNLQEPNLLLNGVPLHCQTGAEAEAKKIFEDVINTPTSRHIVFGLGIGHLFKECCERSKGNVYLYEPNLEVLRITLEMVDFSEELSKPNVFVTSNLDFFKLIYGKTYVHNSNIAFLPLWSYAQVLYYKTIGEIKSRILAIAGSFAAGINYAMAKGFTVAKTALTNLPYVLKAIPLNEIKDTYKDKIAVLVSAGPSLDLNIETIKKNRDKMVLFCVGTAFKALASNGITPDFVNMVEMTDCSGQLLGFDLSDINLITETYTNNSNYKFKVKQNFLFPSHCSSINNYWSNLTGVDVMPYEIIGNVSYMALASAKMLGCTKIILVGQDLAFVNNQCYSSFASYSDLVFDINLETKKPEFKIKDKEKYLASFASADNTATQEEIETFANSKIKQTESALYFVKGINGEMLHTLGDYTLFVENLRSYSLNNPHLDLINSSMIGAQIDGFKNIPLEEALKDAPTIEKIDHFKPYEFDLDRVLSTLELDKKELTCILEEFNEAKELIYKYKREYRHSQKVTPKTIKYIQLLLGLYEKIVNKHAGPLFITISYTEDVEISFKLEDTDKFDTEDTEILFHLLENYFVKVEKKIIEISEKIEQTKGAINESTYSTC